ncbi:MAG: 50S ribosomal protein L30 [Bacteroidales bacterium]|nr:50S ribosomal protein L30 [Candidatus Equimonas enterica]
MATIKIQQTRSRIGAPKDQKRTLDAMGLKKLYHIVELEDNACNRGMIRKVQHLVTVID